MKHSKFIALLSLGISMFAYSQTGKVGVNTENPKEILDVNGTVRVGTLPLHDENIFNGAETKATPFTPAKMVVADNSGVLGSLALPKVIYGGDLVDILPNPVTVRTDNSTYGKPYGSKDLKTVTFTLDQKSIVNVSANVAFNNIKGVASGTFKENDPLKDGNARRIGLGATLTKTGEAAKTIMAVSEIHTQAPPFPKPEIHVLEGTFFLNGATSVLLEPGEYTLVLFGSLYSVVEDRQFKVDFGPTDTDYLNIIAYPTL